MPERPPGKGAAEVAPAGIVAGRPQALTAFERGVERLSLRRPIADPIAHLTEFLTYHRVLLLAFVAADRCGFGGTQRLDLLVSP
jgi:hypothetical protein